MSTHNPPVRNAPGTRKPMPTGGGTTMAPPKSSSGNNTNSTENAEQETLQNDPFSVEFGQHTFDAEGNENPKSGSFTRKVHWPEKENSGVTIGRGYDMGQKSQSEVFRDMTAAGIDTQKARMISLAAGKRGEDAQKYVQDYRDRIGEISPEQQKALFEISYGRKRTAAKGRATKFGAYAQSEKNKKFMLSEEQWDGLSPIIQDYLTDLTYRGDYKNGGYAGYPNINPILKSDQSNQEKIKQLIAIEEKRKATTKESHIKVRCNDRINLLKSGLGGSSGKPAGKRSPSTGPASSTGPAPVSGNGQNQSETYTVQTGETITGIAAKLGVSAEALKAKNKVYSTGNVEYFQSGQVLLIPAGESAPVSSGKGEQGNQAGSAPFGAGQQIEGETGEFPISGALPASPAPGPSGLLAEPPQPKTNQSQELTEEPAKEQRVPPGRIIGGSVGIGGENHPEDVKAVIGRLVALQVINLREARQQDEAHLGQYIIRYQKRVFRSYTDGLVEKGGKTETHLINLNKGRMKAIRPETPGGNPQTNSNQPDPAKERKEASEAKQGQKGPDIDYDGLARKLHIALQGDLFGGGKNPEGALNALKAAKPTARQAEKLATVYMVKYGRNLAMDVKVVYSENGGGSGLDAFWEALGVGGVADNAEPERKPKKPSKKEEGPKEDAISSDSEEVETVHQIIDPEDWRTQSPNASGKNARWKDSEAGWSNCKYVAEKMVYRHLYEELPDDFKRAKVIDDPSGKYKYVVGSMGAHQYLSILREDKSKVKTIVDGVDQQSTFNVQDSAELGIKYLDSYLDLGIPVVVGVDHTFNRNLNKEVGPKKSSKKTWGYNEGTTDHYITIVGKGIDQGRKYYEFIDPGTQHQNLATNTQKNRLFEVEDMTFRGTQPWGSPPRTYHLTSVLLFKKDVSEFKEEIGKNRTITNQIALDFKEKKGDFKK